MPRGKGRGGRCKSQNAATVGSDVEMKDAGGFPRSRDRTPNFKPKHGSDRRSRVGKNSPSPSTGGTRGGKTRGGANAPVSCRTRGRGNNNKRLSIISTASTAQAEPWCDKCSRLNRQLHGYLMDILKSGEDAIGDWAYAVGASPDQMECEPAPERIIPEGYRRCSQQHHLPSGCTSIPRPFGAYAGQQLESTPSQGSAGTSPFSQLGAGMDSAQRTNGALPALAGANPQSNHSLVAIPENAGLQDSRPGPPSQAPLPAPQPIQPPWNGGFGRPVAMYPN